MATTVASLQAVLDLDKRGFDQGIKSADALMTGLATGAATKGIELLDSGVRALAGAMADGVSKAADLEKQIDAIGAISGASADELDQLSELSQNLGLDPDLSVSAQQAADAIETLAAAGVPLEDIFDGAAKGAIALANATGSDFAQAGEIAADAMSVFKIEAEDMGKVVDGVAGVLNASKFDANDYALALAQAGAAAASAGVDYEDFNTIISATASNFASGSDAGTSFKTFLQRLIPASDDATDVMWELGLITEESGNKFFDANGQLQDAATIAQLLSDSLGGLSEQQRNAALQTIFGSDAQRTAIGLMEQGSAGVQKFAETIANTSGYDAAALRVDNASGAFERLQGVTDGLQLAYGTKLLPKLEELATNAATFASTDGPAYADALAGISLRVIELGEQAVPPMFAELAKVVGDLGTNFEKTDLAARQLAELLGIIDEKGEQFSLTGKIMETVMGALTQPLDLLNSILGFMLDNLNGNLSALNKVKNAMVGLGNSTSSVADRISELGAALADLAIPDWMTPGSPMPLETAMWGLGDSIKNLPQIDLSPTVPASTPVNTGSGGTTNNTTVNMGGQSYQYSGGNSKNEALKKTVQLLRYSLEGAR